MENKIPNENSINELIQKYNQAKWSSWILSLAGIFIVIVTVYDFIKTGEFSIAVLAPGLICLLVGASQFRKQRILRKEMDQ